jgi:type I restriction enzyme M protein
LTEFDGERKWRNNRQENEVSWKVNIEDIKAKNWNLDIKNPNKIEIKEELNTQEIIGKIEKNLVEAKSILDQIKNSL